MRERQRLCPEKIRESPFGFVRFGGAAGESNNKRQSH
jgi:hypothetical protein